MPVFGQILASKPDIRVYDPPPAEVEQLVQLHLEKTGFRPHNSSFIIVLMRRLALGGVAPGYAGGAVEGGEVFYGGGE